MSKTLKLTESRPCVFCSQVFYSKDELQAHFRLHANQQIDMKGNPCVPKKRIKEEKVDKDEEKIVKDEDDKINIEPPPDDTSNATCDICGKNFRTTSLAISHKFRKHPESAVKYYCLHCGMMFPIKSNRDTHEKTHPQISSKQLYPCVTCGISFYNLRAQKFHRDSAHKGSDRIINPILTPAPSLKIVLNNAGEAFSVYYCHLCGCEYQVKHNLRKHLETRHSETERNAQPKQIIQCNLCLALFYSTKAYETHGHHHRESDLYATNEKMRKNIVQRIDQDFDRRRVPSVIERHLSASEVSFNRSISRRNAEARRKVEAIQLEENSELGLSPGKSRTASLDLSHSELPIDEVDIKEEFCQNDDQKEEEKKAEEVDDSARKRTDEYIQDESMCWGIDRKKRKRMMDDPEDDDYEIRILGSVNPDAVMPNPQLTCSETDDKVVNVRANDNGVEEVLSKICGEIVKKSVPGNKRCKRKRKERLRKGFLQDLEGCSGDIKPEEEAREPKASCSTSGSEEEEVTVEKIIAMRQKSGVREYLVRWKGSKPEDDTWESEESLDCLDSLIEFLKTTKTVIKVKRSESLSSGKTKHNMRSAQTNTSSRT